MRPAAGTAEGHRRSIFNQRKFTDTFVFIHLREWWPITRRCNVTPLQTLTHDLQRNRHFVLRYNAGMLVSFFKGGARHAGLFVCETGCVGVCLCVCEENKTEVHLNDVLLNSMKN